VSEPTFEELQRELDELVARLERGEVTLDEALTLFERGEELHRSLVERLDRAELTVDELRSADAQTPRDSAPPAG
jgi:exodeoxyribonuclease VII small subunit